MVAVAAGDRHCLALRGDGTVVAWGDNNAGQTNVPASLNNAIAVAAGTDHSLALRNDGTIVAWGEQTNVPAGLSNVVFIAAGANLSQAIVSSLEIASVQVIGRSAMLRFHTFAGQKYSIEYSSNVITTGWAPLFSSSIAGSGTEAAVVDTNALNIANIRFYRVKLVP